MTVAEKWDLLLVALSGVALCLMGILGQVSSIPSSFSSESWQTKAQPIYPLSGVLLALGVMIIGGCVFARAEWIGKKNRLAQRAAFCIVGFGGAAGYLLVNVLLDKVTVSNTLVAAFIASGPNLTLFAALLMLLVNWTHPTPRTLYSI